MNIIIMAGGGGTRLWPLSLRDNPKQFVDLGTGKSLLEHAFDRALKLAQESNIYIATSQQYATKIKELLPGVPENHIFLEPARRDTTAAFVNVCAELVRLGKGNEPAIFLWSDHIFSNEDAFIQDLKKIPAIVDKYPESLVIVGHTPLNPNTTLGYLKVGEQVEDYKNVHKVNQFVEKPDRDTAETYVAAGNYFWNLGYFSLKPIHLLNELVEMSPELKEPVSRLQEAVESQNRDNWKAEFEAFPKEALERTFVEKTKNIYAVTGDYGWSDVGNWATVKDVFGVAGDHVPTGHHIHVDSENNYIYNTTNKAVSLVGLHDAVVVVTDKAVLVTSEDSSHKVKDVVKKIEQEGKEEYL